LKISSIVKALSAHLFDFPSVCHGLEVCRVAVALRRLLPAATESTLRVGENIRREDDN